MSKPGKQGEPGEDAEGTTGGAGGAGGTGGAGETTGGEGGTGGGGGAAEGGAPNELRVRLASTRFTAGDRVGIVVASSCAFALFISYLVNGHL